MILYIIIILVLLIVGWIFTFIEDNEHWFPYGLVGGIIGVVIPSVLLVCIVDTIPTALDVYQGKTTLEITYRDSVPIDTVVVFKNK